jgi:hypothetical protein
MQISQRLEKRAPLGLQKGDCTSQSLKWSLTFQGLSCSSPSVGFLTLALRLDRQSQIQLGNDSVEFESSQGFDQEYT